MRPAREITHAHALNGEHCTAHTHDLTCNLVTAGIRRGQLEVLRDMRRETLAAMRAMTRLLDDITRRLSEIEGETDGA